MWVLQRMIALPALDFLHQRRDGLLFGFLNDSIQLEAGKSIRTATLVSPCALAVPYLKEHLDRAVECISEPVSESLRMVIKDGISLVISEFYTALVKDGYRPLRVVSAAYLLSIEPSLAKVVAESYQDDTLTRNANEIIVQHAVEDLQRVHHESVLTLMM